jgi:hypothetical protein
MAYPSTARHREQPQFPVAGLPSEEFQHGGGVGGGVPLGFGHGVWSLLRFWAQKTRGVVIAARISTHAKQAQLYANPGGPESMNSGSRGTSSPVGLTPSVIGASGKILPEV